MSDIFKSFRLFDKFLFSIIFLLFLIHFKSVEAQDRVTVPFYIKIEQSSEAVPGDTVSVKIIKSEGTEEAHGFDFMIGYDRSKLYGATVNYGELYQIPGDYEWELLALDTGPFQECEAGGCPSGLLEVTSLADIDNGPYHPKTDPATGRIKVIPNGTVLFSINFQMVDQLNPQEKFLPVYFFWTLCSDNQIAFTYDYDGPFDIRSAFSEYVFDSDGLQGWINIADYNSQFPSRFGAPDDCILSEMSERLCNFFNGGISWGCSDLNSDGSINILDIVYLIAYIYKEGPPPASSEYADVNFDTSIDILDIIYLINYLYKDGLMPACPPSQ